MRFRFVRAGNGRTSLLEFGGPLRPRTLSSASNARRGRRVRRETLRGAASERKVRDLDRNVGKRTNLKPDDNGDVSNIPFPKLFTPPQDSRRITLLMALPTLLYSLNASSPNPKNIKRMTEDMGIAHQGQQHKRARLWAHRHPGIASETVPI
jgi:hypothetical protein